MYRGKSFLAIIPARSGSKGIKDKNIINLNNKPLMAYTIEAALKSNLFDYIILSTDSKEYAAIGEKYGAKVPFLRSNEFSGDYSNTKDVILEVINKLKAKGKSYDYFVLLQPTSPLRNESHIRESIDILLNNKGNSVVSICEVQHQSNINIKLNSKNTLDFVFDDLRDVRRQDFDKEYRINGSIYICKIENYLINKSFYMEGSYPYLMDKISSVDIDDIEDLKYAEYLIKEREKTN